MTRYISAILAAALAPLVLHASPGHDAARLRELIESDQAFVKAANPEQTTVDGDHRFDATWTDYSARGRARNRAHAADVLRRLGSIDRTRLQDQDALSYDLLRFKYRLEEEGARFPNEYLIIDQFRGEHLAIPVVLDAMPRSTVRDYEVMLTRLEKLPEMLGQWQQLLEEGLKKGITPPRAALGALPAQVLGQVSSDDPFATPVLSAFASIPSSIPAPQVEALRARARQLFVGRLRPAYERLHAFLRDRYVPGARTTNGFRDLPDGAAWYRFELRRHTASTVTPEAMHQRAMADLEETARAIEEVMTKVGFSGTRQAFRERMDGPDQRFGTSAEVLAAYRNLAARIEPLVPKYFRRLPRSTFTIELSPAYIGVVRPAYYLEPSADGKRPATFVVPRDPAHNPKWQMASWTLHEGLPGHHLERGLGVENKQRPDFRLPNVTAFTEGWAEYAEHALGGEMGFYDDPYSRYGMLIGRMILHAGIAVDTGLHALGWTRERAIELRRQYVGGPEVRVIAATNRLSVWPGQILSYHVGGMTIRELRAECERRLGPAFDVRDFHDAVLRDGPLPLDLLGDRVRAHCGRQQ